MPSQINNLQSNLKDVDRLLEMHANVIGIDRAQLTGTFEGIIGCRKGTQLTEPS